MSFSDVAHHVYFTETGVPLATGDSSNAPFVGSYEDTDYYLFLGDVLRREHLRGLHNTGKKRVIYAEGRVVSDLLLSEHRATFKQVPYAVRQ